MFRLQRFTGARTKNPDRTLGFVNFIFRRGFQEAIHLRGFSNIGFDSKFVFNNRVRKMVGKTKKLTWIFFFYLIDVIWVNKKELGRCRPSKRIVKIGGRLRGAAITSSTRQSNTVFMRVLH